MSSAALNTLLDDAEVYHRRAQRAEIEDKINIYKTLREGADAEALAARLELHVNTIYKYAREGERHFLHPPERDPESSEGQEAASA